MRFKFQVGVSRPALPAARLGSAQSALSGVADRNRQPAQPLCSLTLPASLSLTTQDDNVERSGAGRGGGRLAAPHDVGAARARGAARGGARRGGRRRRAAARVRRAVLGVQPDAGCAQTPRGLSACTAGLFAAPPLALRSSGSGTALSRASLRRCLPPAVASGRSTPSPLPASLTTQHAISIKHRHRPHRLPAGAAQQLPLLRRGRALHAGAAARRRPALGCARARLLAAPLLCIPRAAAPAVLHNYARHGKRPPCPDTRTHRVAPDVRADQGAGRRRPRSRVCRRRAARLQGGGKRRRRRRGRRQRRDEAAPHGAAQAVPLRGCSSCPAASAQSSPPQSRKTTQHQHSTTPKQHKPTQSNPKSQQVVSELHDASEYGATVGADGRHSGGAFEIEVAPETRVEELRRVIRVRTAHANRAPTHIAAPLSPTPTDTTSNTHTTRRNNNNNNNNRTSAASRRRCSASRLPASASTTRSAPWRTMGSTTGTPSSRAGRSWSAAVSFTVTAALGRGLGL